MELGNLYTSPEEHIENIYVTAEPPQDSKEGHLEVANLIRKDVAMESIYNTLKRETEDIYTTVEPTKDIKVGHLDAPASSANVDNKARWFKALLFFCFLLMAALAFLAVYYFMYLGKMKEMVSKIEVEEKFFGLNYTALLEEKKGLLKNITDLETKNGELSRNHAILQFQYKQLNQRLMAGDKSCPTSVHDKACSMCPQTWLLFNSKCYFFSSDELNWSDSQNHCTSLGGHLAIIESKVEQDFLITLMEIQGGEEDSYWIGLTDQETEGYFVWVDNTPLDPHKGFWGTREIDDGKEPDNWEQFSPTGEDCVYLYKSTRYSGWYDIYCKVKTKRICEAAAPAFQPMSTQQMEAAD
ncbi:C-type lectin domain family 4 member F-like isoform X2 [Polypterus senegalus]|uniref:C-type lectin domain family 4 member F-like isoform X2 n=1 Tax=Polypterus senegalus TaxID=55291 RepID=UPI0019660987|nr:C-type lectin domain family 4 member F-like isoform X2 [Polypterus senegalus]